ncbi:DUF262 domain-containing protein [Rhizobium sp. PL01]|uniref:GmrSD restriction endonuclease domain-containing protein n=1 Tax=Rhizobium sp. PL01 TaxID=3085631 RepID=UPI0029818325|nr:DUF262 domain-containing protein [Rhizobium sp. PL01]MDW5315080.1 DUF262 domain-containing protein [Rhizobium sp. PL01]
MQNTSQAPAASARPDIISLDVMLRDIDEGRIRIPKFQRPYVWTPQMMRELFQSVLSGYPIGSLLLWEPRDADVPSLGKIGPIQTPEKVGNAGVSFVLDGHQRLATLYGVLRLPDISNMDANTRSDRLAWNIAFDLEKDETRQMRFPDDVDNPAILPLRAVLRTSEFIRFARRIDESEHFTSDQKALFLDRADNVQRAIRDYRIPLTIMKDGTVDDAVAIFSRVNRTGRKISADEMASALTFHEGFDLEEKIDEILGSLDEFGFGDINRNIILQSLLHAAKQNFTKPNFDNLATPSTRDAIKAAVVPVRESLRLGAQFLNSQIGFRTGRLLPYAFQLFLLGVFFRTFKDIGKPDLKTVQHNLKRWFWATSFEGWFASANSSDIEKAVRAFEAFADQPSDQNALQYFEKVFIDRPLKPFPKTFDRRSARIRAMLLVQIVRGQVIDPITGQEIDGSELMADPDRRDLPYVFRPEGVAESRSPANRILLPRSHGASVRDQLANVTGNNLALESHAIDVVGAQALRDRNVVAFVSAREAELARQEAEFLQEFDLHIGEQTERSEDEVDIEE